MTARTLATRATNPLPSRACSSFQRCQNAVDVGFLRRIRQTWRTQYSGTLRDGREFAVEHSGKAQHVVALAMQGHARRANPVGREVLTQPQLRDDEIEQCATLLELRPGQRQHVAAEPAGQGLDVAGHKARLHFGLTGPAQPRGQPAAILSSSASHRDAPPSARPVSTFASASPR